MARLVHDQIVAVTSRPLVQDQVTRVPATGSIVIPANLGYRSIEVMITLSLEDKEATGNTLDLMVYRADDTFIAGINWVSYGGVHTVRLPDGTTIVDPDPTIVIPMANTGAQHIYATYRAHGIANGGMTVNGLS